MRVAALIRCGQLCGSCGNSCRKDYSAGVTYVGCPVCNETGLDRFGEVCKHCDDGQFMIETCPRQYVGHDMVQAVNYVAFADKGFLPVDGGMLDQSAWWLDVYRMMNNEQNQIDSERMKQNGS